MTLKELTADLRPLQLVGDMDIEIKDIQFDSRKVTAGSLFVATRGTAVDGHDFIPYHCHIQNQTPRQRPLFIQELFWDDDGWPYVGNNGKPPRDCRVGQTGQD